MRFKQVIGQHEVKTRLLQSVSEGRISHTQMFWGPPGSGKFALALAYSQYLNCTNRQENDSCGQCPSCIKAQRLTHPDIHFIYPTTTTKKVKKDPESKLFSEEWRNFVISNKGYIGLNQWHEYLGVENKQASIFVRDGSEIIRRLSFKAYEGKFKIMIIWMVERLNIATANKLLKQLEEPPENTIFLLIAEQTDLILTTVKSRAFQVKIPRLDDDSLLLALAEARGVRQADVKDVATMAYGNWLEANRLYENADDEKYNFHELRQWMRLCFKDNIPMLIDFCANMGGIGRERQKAFLQHGLSLFRNSLINNHNLQQMVRLPEDELDFMSKFAPFVHHNNLITFTELMEEGIRQIERNAYAPLVFMDTSLKMIHLLKLKV